jgi:hypothetical protein
MFGSNILDIALGMIFVYLTLSLACSAINEWIASLGRSRARHLEAWVRELLAPTAPGQPNQGSVVFDQFQRHPLIRALSHKGSKPAYIPSRTFMLALLDVIAPSEPEQVRTVDTIRQRLATPDPATPLSPDLQKTLVALIDDAGDDVEKVRRNIEGWYNDAMERLGGWYKRRSQAVILGIALAVTLALNVNSFHVFNTLYRDATVRAAVVAAAERAAQQSAPAGDQSPLTQIDEVQHELQQLSLPVGWGDARLRPDFKTPFGIVAAIVGWLLTALAVSQGAPFWFDMLNKVVNVRSTGARPPTSSEQPPTTEAQVLLQTTAPSTNGQSRSARIG